MGVRGQLSVPSVVLGAEMAGASLYGSFKAGVSFGSGEASAVDWGSRWGIKGTNEVSEGLTASYKFEGKLSTNNAETFGGTGHAHDAVDDDDTTPGDAVDTPAMGTFTSHSHAATAANGGPGGRLSYVNLAGGFGTVSVGQNWSASALHYGFAVDGSHLYGSFGGATGRNGNTISYASSAGDVAFQIDKVTGTKEKLEIGVTAALGPVGVGFGYWKSGADVTDVGKLTGVTDGASFTGVAIAAGAGGVNLSVGLGSESKVKNVDGEVIDRDTSIIKVSGSLGDSGVSYVVQVANSSDANNDQNTISLTNDLGGGASIIFEHWDPDPGVGDALSFLGLKVDF